jgi:hypothetical protein
MLTWRIGGIRSRTRQRTSLQGVQLARRKVKTFGKRNLAGFQKLSKRGLTVEPNKEHENKLRIFFCDTVYSKPTV